LSRLGLDLGLELDRGIAEFIALKRLLRESSRG